MIITMAIFTGEHITINAIILTLISIAIFILIYKIKERKNRAKKKETEIAKDISIGFYLGVSNILTLICVLVFSNYVI